MQELFTPVAESQVAAPSDMMAIGDSVSMTFMRILYSKDSESGKRHNNKLNVVFCDGHVESPTLKFLFEDTGDAALVRWNRDHLPHREKLSP
jgi:prepilin-type processing-associated H-X9-DG protein